MTFNKTFEYTVAVREYHYFKSIWQAKKNEGLVCQFKYGNSSRMFAINLCDQRGTMVGHLPREISRITKFIIVRGATVSVMLPGTRYRQWWVGDPLQSINFHARVLPKSSLVGKI